MSLLGTLNTAKTALAANQVALQTTGNNIANAGNADFTRQVVSLVANGSQQIRQGLFVGMGVDVDSVSRQIDESIEQRMRASISDAQGNQATNEWLQRVQSVYNELSDSDVSTGMSTFFNSWSELANKPQDLGLRQVVVQDGANLADRLQTTRTQLNGLRSDLSSQIKTDASLADTFATKIASLNQTIAQAEGGAGGEAGTLRDQRDATIKQLSAIMNVTTAPGDNGMVNVFVGTEPLVTNGTSRGVTIRNDDDPANGEVSPTVVFKRDDGTIPFTSGTLAGEREAKGTLDKAVKNIDQLASSLIFEVNKLHSSGQALTGISNVQSEHAVADPDVVLNDDKAHLDFKPQNGSFVVHVKDKATGAVTSTLINVDLDGTGTQTTLNTLKDSIDGVDDVSASVSAGRLSIKADTDAVEVSFSQDSSGVLATLGIGGYFSGTDASDIAVNSNLQKDPAQLAAAKNGDPADNQTAKAIAALQNQTLGSLGDKSLNDAYQQQINDIADKVAGAKKDADAAQVVQETLQTQHDAISGVSLDEEAINLMKYQRAYQAASRVIAATDAMMQTILNLV